MKKLILSCIAVCGAALCAEVPVPSIAASGHINGRVNLAVWRKAGEFDPAQYGGGWTKLEQLNYTYEFRVRGDGETEYVEFQPAAGELVANDSAGRGYSSMLYNTATNGFGSLFYQVRAVDGATGEKSEWTADIEICESFSVAAQGTEIRSEGCQQGRAFDERVNTIIDAFSPNGGSGKWVGYKFARPARIGKVRFWPRLDFPDRYRNSTFEVAADETFADPITMHTVESDYCDTRTPAEVVFSPPLEATAIRHMSAPNCGNASAEVEFVPAELPMTAEIACESSDMTNFWPRLSVSVARRWKCARWRIERATGANGPWTVACDWRNFDGAEAATFTDADESAVKVGLALYYRAAVETAFPGYEGQIAHSAVVAHTRLRRLDRAWDDESAFAPGAALMPAPDADAAATAEFAKAFDGDPATFGDVAADAANAAGPVGVAFGEKAWVKAFGYVCRADGEHARIRLARLYSADAEDAALAGKTARSEFPAESAADGAWRLCEATSLPATGAERWFLWGEGWRAGVAEVAFFGWTRSDLEGLGVLLAPEGVTLERRAEGMLVAWQPSSGATGYRIERRASTAAEWSSAGTVGAAAREFLDAALTAGRWEFRVTALGSGGAQAIGDAVAEIWYAPGSGRGLRKIALWPSSAGSARPDDECNIEATAESAVELTAAAGEELAAGAADNVRVVWTGRLVVPIAGSYAFSLETTSGGGLVRIAGRTLINMHSESGIAKVSGPIVLPAGETDIRVEYLALTGGKECKFYWEGPMPKEQIPLTQLIGGEDGDVSVDGWRPRICVSGNTGLGNRIYGVFAKDADGSIAMETPILGGSSLTAGWMNMAVASRKLRGNCYAEIAVERLDELGSAGLIIQNAAGHYALWQFCHKRDNNTLRSWFALETADNQGNGFAQPVYKEGPADLADAATLRVERRGRDFVFTGTVAATGEKFRREWTAPEGMFESAVWVGLSGQGSGAYPFKPSKWRLSGAKAVEVKGLVLIVR